MSLIMNKERSLRWTLGSLWPVDSGNSKAPQTAFGSIQESKQRQVDDRND